MDKKRQPPPDRILTIAVAGNTDIPCLQAIAMKGYTVTLSYHGETPGEWENPQWVAEKNGRVFIAGSTEELLGLIAMWEVRGDDWRLKAGEADLFDRLVEAAVMYDDEGNVIDR